jgi:MarR family transcriptional regulator, organic hydroperoxide resistance regulator
MALMPPCTIDPHDRRVRRLVLTPEGEAIRRKLIRRAISDAPTSSLMPAEQAALRDVLGKIAEPVDLPI